MSASDDPEARVKSALDETNHLVRVADSGAAQAILGTAPWTGGVGALIANKAAKRQEARLREFLVEVVQEVRDLEQSDARKVDYEVFETDEFAALLMAILEEAARTTDQDRLYYLRQFIINSTMRIRPDVTWVDLFKRYVQQLAGAHIGLLHDVYKLQKSYPASDRLGKKKLRHVPVCVSDLSRPPYGTQLVRVTLSDLATLGLLVDWRSIGGDSDPQECYSLTRNGMLFVRFVLGDWPEAPGVDPVD